MNEATAALIGSVATGVFGLIGIVIAQIVSWKTAKLRSKEERIEPVTQKTQGELPFGNLPGTGLTGFAMIRLDLESLKLLIIRSHEESMVRLQSLTSQLQDVKTCSSKVVGHKESS